MRPGSGTTPLPIPFEPIKLHAHILMRRVVVTAPSGASETYDADALVMAVGVTAVQGIVARSPLLAEQSQFTGRCYVYMHVCMQLCV